MREMIATSIILVIADSLVLACCDQPRDSGVAKLFIRIQECFLYVKEYNVGSILGPVLFILYVNDDFDHVRSKSQILWGISEKWVAPLIFHTDTGRNAYAHSIKKKKKAVWQMLKQTDREANCHDINFYWMSVMAWSSILSIVIAQ